MNTNGITTIGISLGFVLSAGLLLSGCGSKQTTAPTARATTVSQQQQQIQENPNLSPQAKAAAAAAYSSFANRPSTSTAGH